MGFQNECLEFILTRWRIANRKDFLLKIMEGYVNNGGIKLL